MSKSGVQFHADPDELYRFVSEVALESALYVSAIWKGQGFRVTPKGSNFLDLIAVAGPPRWVFITQRKPVAGEYRTTQDFLRTNLGALSVHVGQLTQDGLDESSMGFMTSDEDVTKTWRKVLDRLKRQTQMGAKATSVVTGLSGDAKSHRYTAAALELARKGVTMWALGLKTILKFPDSKNPDTRAFRRRARD